MKSGMQVTPQRTDMDGQPCPGGGGVALCLHPVVQGSPASRNLSSHRPSQPRQAEPPHGGNKGEPGEDVM